MPTDRENETAVAVADPLVGSIFDKRFRVDERIAAGGFGAIYRATHVKSGHPIALKVLHPTLASDLGVLARFRREGTTLTSLRNPHTITAYEFGQSDKTLFIVLELLHGESLYDHYSTHGPLEWKRVVHIAKQVCESLEEAHAQGIVHRDLKPTNIHLETHEGDPDFVKVLDFGIAKILRGSDHAADDITNVGQMIGTLDYMSPEQMVGGQVTGQTDIYTLGIVMYEMIAGTRPFPESTTAGAALAAMLKTTPEPLYLRAPVPRPLDEIVMRCLERETTRRYRSVGQLREDLERLGSDGPAANTTTVRVGKEAVDDGDETAVTPPPAVESRTAPLPKQAPPPEWDDEDELAPTSTRMPDGSSLALDPTKPVTVGPSRPSPRSLVGGRGEPQVPQVVVAPFSTPRARSFTGQVPHNPQAAALGVAPTAVHTPVAPPSTAPPAPPRPMPGPPPQGLPPGVPSPFHGPGSGSAPSLAAASLSGPHGRAPTAIGPHGVLANSPTVPPSMGGAPSSLMTTSPGHAPARVLPGGVTPLPGSHGALPHSHSPTAPPRLGANLPPTPPPHIAPAPNVGAQGQRLPTAAYDMGTMSARETLIRRLVWILVLFVAAGIGFVVASQL